MSVPRLFHKMGKRSYCVNDIVSIDCRKRLFCVFDRDKPWKVVVEYEDPHTSWDVGFLALGRYGILLHDTYKPTSVDVIRMSKVRAEGAIGRVRFLKDVIAKEEARLEKSFLERVENDKFI